MRKYYCDICDNEITGMVKLGSLDFRRGVLELCSSCYPKFKPAKQSIFATYNTSYSTLDSEYIDSLKEIILEPDVEPQPEWEDNNT